MIYLSPIGDFDTTLLDHLRQAVEALFGIEGGIVHLMDDLQFAWDPARKQYHTTPILEQLAALAPDRCLKIVGLTTADLFIPILTYVYGEAQLGGKASLVSTHRLSDPGTTPSPPPSLRDRVVKEVVHELGHTFKLVHCPEPTCIMHYARCIDDVDRKTERFCRHCRVLLKDEMGRLGRGSQIPKNIRVSRRHSNPGRLP